MIMQKQTQTNPNQTQNLLALKGAKPKQTQILPAVAYLSFVALAKKEAKAGKPNRTKILSASAGFQKIAALVQGIELFVEDNPGNYYHFRCN
ncbi:MAG: hypothetical protein JW947_05635 [Sedimentisphaerales bacterium]|nr:hypothetical protein [Sedimentisphaerales bacterium]